MIIQCCKESLKWNTFSIFQRLGRLKEKRFLIKPLSEIVFSDTRRFFVFSARYNTISDKKDLAHHLGYRVFF